MQNVAEIRVLIVPLDWGLGHATRSIPIIQEFLKRGYKVFIAGEGKIVSLLQQEFPQLNFLQIKGYRISYARNSWALLAGVLLQLPKIFFSVQHEHAWLKNAVREHHIDVVISDNRYGLHHPEIHSVFITHQLYIKTPFGFAGRLLQKLNYHYLNQFNECWVPDFEHQPNLAGLLSHPEKKPRIPVKYIGALSRFQQIQATEPKHLLVLLSGPEPQRTLLEKRILKQLACYKEPVVLVRGLPGNTSLPPASGNLSIINHLPAKKLQEVIANASIVISRCGYSTVMDLMKMKKKSVLIPTPGQTEQEYLARHLMKNNLALCIPQNRFNLKNILPVAEAFPYRFFKNDTTNDLEKAVEHLTNSLKKSQ